MCTYNRAHLISDSIKSCIAQTLQDWELIIVDDFSTDNTREVVEKFNDNRITFIESKNHIGRSAARNMALLASKGDVISFLDSDDLIAPEKIDFDCRILEINPNISAVYSTAQSVDIKSGKILGNYPAEISGDLYKLIAYYLPLVIATSQVTIRRNVYESVGTFDEQLDRFEDTDYFRRISIQHEWYANSTPSVILKNHSDNIISNQNQATIIEMIERYTKKVEVENKKLKRADSKYLRLIYLHYAQAFFVQKRGLRNSLILYTKLLRKQPSQFCSVSISIIKMTKHRLLNFSSS